jgi:hypothetical protein
MIRLVLAAALLLAVPAFGGPALAADKRVYKVDSVIATAKGKTVVVQAKGAVSSGGWKNARLHMVRSDGKTLVMEFIATPPPPDMTVIEVLVPMEASVTIRPHGPVAAVQVMADANDVTAQLLH